MALVADIITANLKVSLDVGQAMLNGVTPEMFARFPTKDGKAVNTNHPAFVYGHLSLYGARMLTLVGRDNPVAAAPAGFDALFKAGVECQDDPTGKVYPAMPVVMDAFLKANKTALEGLAGVADDVFARPNPAEGRFKEMFPTVGGAVAFLAGSHLMDHFGQVSAWRRFMGLGRAY
jgi:hypothetical protein